MIDAEVWKPVLGFEGLYEVSNHGRVRSLDRVLPINQPPYLRSYKGRMLRPGTATAGHQLVMLGRSKPILVHVLVLNSFVGPAKKGEWCRHLDDNPANNHLSNLRWGTPYENVLDSFKNNKRGRDKSTGQFTPPKGDL